MSKSIRQQLVESYIPWLVIGFLFVGSVFDTIVNAAELVTPIVTYVGTIIFLAGYVALRMILQRYPLRWLVSDKQYVYVKSFGKKPLVMLIGVLCALWLPRIPVFEHPKQVSEAPPLAVSTPIREISASEIEPTPNHNESDISLIDGCLSVMKWFPDGQLTARYSYDPPIIITPEPQTDCWYLYDWGFYVDDTSIIIDSRDIQTLGRYAIRTPLSNNTNINFNLQIDKLGWGEKIEIGLSPEPSSYVKEGVFLVFWGAGRNRQVIQILRYANGNEEFIGPKHIEVDGINSNQDGLLDVEMGSNLNIQFKIVHARLTIFVNGEEANYEPINVVYSNPNLLIGHEVSLLTRGNSVATISGLVVHDN